MTIQVRCPQCEKAYKLADDKNGKQVRCPACSQLFRAEPSAKANAASEAVAPAPRKTAAPQAIASAPRKAASPKTKPGAAPTVAKKWPVWMIGLIVAVPLLVCGGGAAAVIAGAWYLFGTATSTVNSIAKANGPTVTAADSQTSQAEPPTTTGNGNPTKPPDTPAPPNPSATANWDTFAKIDRGMTMDQVVALLGQPATVENLDPAVYVGMDSRLFYTPEPNLKFTIYMGQGKVVKKINSGNRPNHYPSGDIADKPPGKNPPTGVNPPPDKPPPAPKVQITQDLFNMIDRGMTRDQVVALAGQPTGVDDLSRLNNPDVDTRLSWDNYIADIGFTVDMVQGKVTSKRGYSKGKLWPVVYPSGAPPTKPVGTLTRANFDKIDKGMSADDVIALIGQPSATLKLDPKFGGADTEMTFFNLGTNTNVAAVVDFFQGKVVKKTNPQNWPIVYPSEKGK